MGLLKIAKKGADELVELAEGLLSTKEVVPKRSRKKVADMTPEEHEAHKAWQRENNLKKNLAKDPNYVPRGSPKRLLTPEEIEAQEAGRRARDAERKRAARNNPEKGEKLRSQARDSYQRNKDKRRAEQKVYYQENREAILKRNNEYYSDPEFKAKKSEYGKTYYQENKEARLAATKRRRGALKKEDPLALAEKEREYALRHREKDPVAWRASKAAQAAKRRTRAVTPPWANESEIDEIHSTASLIRQLTGEPWEVDHMIPYQGRKVTGFNHPDNLLIVPRAENRSKGASFAPGQEIPAGGVEQARRLLKQLQKAKEGS